MLLNIINGPNLNLVGMREPDIYGARNFQVYLEQLQKNFPKQQLEYFQSNVEGEIINHIQKVGFKSEGIIINAGGYTHTSVAIADALKAVAAPYIEVHISNIYNRENYRQKSMLSPNARGIISGFGLESYTLAILYFVSIIKEEK